MGSLKFQSKKVNQLLLNPLSKLACWVLFPFMDSLKLVWIFIVECTMRPLCVIELAVCINAFYKPLFRFVLCTIDLFPLHGHKKGLHNRVVMRLSGFGKDWTALFIRNSLRNVFEVYCAPCHCETLGTEERFFVEKPA